jgi:hypothetical protein
MKKPPMTLSQLADAIEEVKSIADYIKDLNARYTAILAADDASVEIAFEGFVFHAASDDVLEMISKEMNRRTEVLCACCHDLNLDINKLI